MTRKRGYKRGHSVALLVGFEDKHAVLWRIYKHVIKLHLKLEIKGKRTDANALYNFYESIIDALKPSIKEGVRSVVITAPNKTNYSVSFLDHIKKHHQYLLQSKVNRTTFGKIVGSADSIQRVTELVKTKEFHKMIENITSEESNYIVQSLDKLVFKEINNSNVLFSIKEIEDFVYNQDKCNVFKTEYLMLTEKYLAACKNKTRVYRLLQISKNKGIKTRIINEEALAGKRISQLGGLVFFKVI